MSNKDHLCKWDANMIEAKMDDLVKMVAKPRFVCEKCARSARQKKHLCKPYLFKEKKESK